MNKKLYLLLALAATLPGCVEDTGNYDYQPAEQVTPGTVAGIDDTYNIVALDSLKITPAIDGPEDAYTYAWQAYPVPTQYDSPTYLIGEEKNLKYQVVLPEGAYEIVLEVKDKELQTCTYVRTTLNVTLEFSQGWFIAKAVGNETDIDFIKLANGVVYPEILKSINGERPPGAPVSNGYISTYYGYEITKPDGTTTTVQDQSAFFVTTDEDLRVYKAGEITLLKTFDDAFFERPAVKRPQALHLTLDGVVLMNDGKLHNIATYSYNFGRFGHPINAGPGDVDLSPFSLRTGLGIFFFDNRSSTLKLFTYPYSALEDLESIPGTDLVYMHEQEADDGYYGAYALMKDRSSGDLSILTFSPVFYLYYGMGPDIIDVPAGSELYGASIFAVSHTNEAIYYSRGDNKVGYFTVYNAQDTPDIITLPADEHVAFIRHVYNDYMAFECLAVLANGPTGWKLYCYNFEGYTPDVQLPAFQTFSGEGEAHSFLYRDVSTVTTN
ncbi:MAG: hypothetical protein LBK12_06310 [Odoribacteraceae bacterium]|jgi:hypothetical protein|nr:hypothetical protein [Odoribacteraceae bacterium]